MRAVALSGGAGLLSDDGTVAELEMPYPSLTAYLRDGGRLESLDRVSVRRRLAPEAARLDAIAGSESAVWGVGLNYRSKQLATGREAPEQPVIFVKGPAATCPSTQAILLPSASRCVDYEAEIAVLVGSQLHKASTAEARRAVAGYAAGNDVTARDVMRWTNNPSLAKSFPGFGQFGSVVEVTIDGWPGDPIPLSSSVNGEIRQLDTSEGMLLPVQDLLAYISRFTCLRPGDVVLSGTPAGTGDEQQRYLGGGDVVEVAVGDLPPLISQVADANTGPDARPG